jgi:hypothetical protein
MTASAPTQDNALRELADGPVRPGTVLLGSVSAPAGVVILEFAMMLQI